MQANKRIQRRLALNERQKKEIGALSDAAYEALIALAQKNLNKGKAQRKKL
ncbi:MAG: hypothetical protein HY619_07810 [Thaumarchaeota archaeon]|nr:hypothetical protein [Nitrososphaerota archaeon]